MTDPLSALADAALDTLLATLDDAGRVLAWSRGAAALSGHSPEQARGRALGALLPGTGDWEARLHSARSDGRCAVGGGFEGSLYDLGLAPGPARFGLMLRAVQAPHTETTREQLTQLNRRLLEQEKQTSRRLAQSLHDELGQTLAALRLHWEARRDASDEQRERMDERIGNLVVLANRQVRGVLAEMRPPLLDELGLAAAIDNEIRQHPAAEGEAHLQMQASAAAELQRWPADIEYAVFMIAREALLNALRHAGARAISVQLDGDAQWLQLRVADDGQGLAPEVGTARPGQLGLVAMRERALAIGASLRIDGRSGHGTMVELSWELPDEAQDDEPHLSDR